VAASKQNLGAAAKGNHSPLPQKKRILSLMFKIESADHMVL
jgi:hypothetical protein